MPILQKAIRLTFSSGSRYTSVQVDRTQEGTVEQQIHDAIIQAKNLFIEEFKSEPEWDLVRVNVATTTRQVIVEIYEEQY